MKRGLLVAAVLVAATLLGAMAFAFLEHRRTISPAGPAGSGPPDASFFVPDPVVESEDRAVDTVTVTVAGTPVRLFFPRALPDGPVDLLAFVRPGTNETDEQAIKYHLQTLGAKGFAAAKLQREHLAEGSPTELFAQLEAALRTVRPEASLGNVALGLDDATGCPERPFPYEVFLRAAAALPRLAQASFSRPCAEGVSEAFGTVERLPTGLNIAFLTTTREPAGAPGTSARERLRLGPYPCPACLQADLGPQACFGPRASFTRASGDLTLAVETDATAAETFLSFLPAAACAFAGSP